MSMPSESKSSFGVCFLAVVGSFLILYGVVKLMLHYTRADAVGQARAAERLKFQKEMRAADTEALTHYGWVDQGKGLVRLPVERAMELAVAAGKNPAAARSNLIERIEKATAVPPKAPEKPSAYE